MELSNMVLMIGDYRIASEFVEVDSEGTMIFAVEKIGTRGQINRFYEGILRR